MSDDTSIHQTSYRDGDTIDFPPLVSPPDASVVALHPMTISGFKRVSPLLGLSYLDMLKQLHHKRQVRRYLEIGTAGGKSLSLSRGAAVAIDPEFLLNKDFWSGIREIHFFEMTSDAFFVTHDPQEILGGSIDLAFIDGMHLSEFVLRDFMNIEQYCKKESLILLHDAIPGNFEMTERLRNHSDRSDKDLADAWTGDVWRVVPLLRSERPDLNIQVLDCPPTGLVLVSHLDPQYRMAPGRLEALMHILRDSVPSETEFWAFIESLTVADSREMLRR